MMNEIGNINSSEYLWIAITFKGKIIENSNTAGIA